MQSSYVKSQVYKTPGRPQRTDVCVFIERVGPGVGIYNGLPAVARIIAVARILGVVVGAL